MIRVIIYFIIMPLANRLVKLATELYIDIKFMKENYVYFSTLRIFFTIGTLIKLGYIIFHSTKNIAFSYLLITFVIETITFYYEYKRYIIFRLDKEFSKQGYSLIQIENSIHLISGINVKKTYSKKNFFKYPFKCTTVNTKQSIINLIKKLKDWSVSE